MFSTQHGRKWNLSVILMATSALCTCLPTEAYGDFLDQFQSPSFDYYEDGYFVSELKDDTGEVVFRVGVGAVNAAGVPLFHDDAGNLYATAGADESGDALWRYTWFFEGLCESTAQMDGPVSGAGNAWDWDPAVEYTEIVSDGANYYCTDGLSVWTFRPGIEYFGNWVNPDRDEYDLSDFNPEISGTYTYAAFAGGSNWPGESYGIRSVVNVHVSDVPPTPDPTPVPEPTSMTLLGLGLIAMAIRRRTES